jgi:hypothetical protein
MGYAAAAPSPTTGISPRDEQFSSTRRLGVPNFATGTNGGLGRSEVAIKLGASKQREKVSLKDLRSAPIWMQPYGEYGETLRPVLTTDPDVTREIFKQCYAPTILCTVREQPQLFARGWYHRSDRNLSMLRFWQGGEWVKVNELKARRPLTLVAVPKIEGKAGVEFYLLTRYDLDAPRIGGTLHRVAGPDRFKLQKLGRGMVPQRIKAQPRRRASAPAKQPARQGPVRLVGAKLGPLTSPGKVRLEDCIKHPIWVSTYEEDKAAEDAVRAVISRDPNVSSDVLRKFLEAVVTFKVSGTDVYGIGTYEREDDALSSVRFWSGKRWDSKFPSGLSAPLTLEPLCRILGKRDVRFTLRKVGDRSAPRATP